MQAAGRAVAMETAERVYCPGTMPDGEPCRQLIARRLGNDIDPIGMDRMQLDSKGRPVIVCPKCGRFSVVRREVKDGE